MRCHTYIVRVVCMPEWWDEMHHSVSFRSKLFHLSRKPVLHTRVISCAGVSTGSLHFPGWAQLQLACHPQLHKSALLHSHAPTWKPVSNVIVIVPGHLSEFLESYFHLPGPEFSWTAQYDWLGWFSIYHSGHFLNDCTSFYCDNVRISLCDNVHPAKMAVWWMWKG